MGFSSMQWSEASRSEITFSTMRIGSILLKNSSDLSWIQAKKVKPVLVEQERLVTWRTEAAQFIHPYSILGAKLTIEQRP